MLASFPKVPKIGPIASESAENRRFRLPHLSLDALTPENPCEYPHKPYIARNQSHWAISLPLTSVVLSLFKFS